MLRHYPDTRCFIRDAHHCPIQASSPTLRPVSLSGRKCRSSLCWMGYTPPVRFNNKRHGRDGL